jgi:hypothetical protein
MFTIKYRTWNPAPEDSETAIPGSWVKTEQLWGPFEFVSSETRANGLEVYGYYKGYHDGDQRGLPMTFGPFCDAPKEQPHPVLWVMNESGATVAKYEL